MSNTKHLFRGALVGFAAVSLTLGASVFLTGEPDPATPTVRHHMVRNTQYQAVSGNREVPTPNPAETEDTDTDPVVPENADTNPEPSSPSVVELCPLTAYGDQGAVDTGALVLWSSSPYLIAGHDNMGWSWLDDIATGTTVAVTCGPATGTYVVTGHQWQETKGGQMPSWMYSEDLILQTCTGSTGMGFSILDRI